MTRQNTGWIVAAVLALVVIALLWMLWYRYNQEEHDLGFVLQQGKEDISTERDRILRTCNGPNADQAACQEELTNLSELLAAFKANVENASTSSSTSATSY